MMELRLIFRTSQLSFDDGETQKDKQGLLWLWGLMRVRRFVQANPDGHNAEAQNSRAYA